MASNKPVKGSVAKKHPRKAATPSLVRQLDRPEYYINRELSWLEFNQRVLEEACDPASAAGAAQVPAISASNLDEFFEVRVAGLQRSSTRTRAPGPPPDGLRPAAEQLRDRPPRHDVVAEQYETWHEESAPGSREHGIRICLPEELTPESDDAFLDEYSTARSTPC